MILSVIRTLVVDDSVFMRTILKNALGAAPRIEVVGSAQNGQEALEKIASLKPDVVTLDIEMPGLTGLDVLVRVMKSDPLPIVMVSTKTQEGAELTFKALDLGAVDYVAKPLADKSASLQSFQAKVVQAVEAAFASNRKRLVHSVATRILKPRAADLSGCDKLIAIGISAGGPATLHKLIPVLPASFPPIVVTQHMPADFTGPFAKRLNDVSDLLVKEAEHGDAIRAGQLLLAPGNRHMRVVGRVGNFTIELDDGPKVSGFRPSVDVLFESVAQTYRGRSVGLVMTGMGCDGSVGVRKLRDVGATTLAQDAESSVVYGMPKAAFETGCVDRVVSLAEIPEVLTRLLSASEARVG